jgi:hypothetical protein
MGKKIDLCFVGVSRDFHAVILLFQMADQPKISEFVSRSVDQVMPTISRPGIVADFLWAKPALGARKAKENISQTSGRCQCA